MLKTSFSAFLSLLEGLLEGLPEVVLDEFPFNGRARQNLRNVFILLFQHATVTVLRPSRRNASKATSRSFLEAIKPQKQTAGEASNTFSLRLFPTLRGKSEISSITHIQTGLILHTFPTVIEHGYGSIWLHIHDQLS